jgi:hypothetical protein
VLWKHAAAAVEQRAEQLESDRISACAGTTRQFVTQEARQLSRSLRQRVTEAVKLRSSLGDADGCTESRQTPLVPEPFLALQLVFARPRSPC